MKTLYTKAELVIARLVPALTAAGAKNVRSDVNSIEFNGNNERHSLFGLVGPSRVVFDSGVLRYRCSMSATAAIVSAMASFLFLFVVIVPPKDSISWTARFAIPVGAWFWMFGMNYLIKAIRFRRFLKRALSNDCG